MCTGDGEELIRLTTRFGKVDLGRGIRRAVTEARVRVASRARQEAKCVRPKSLLPGQLLSPPFSRTRVRIHILSSLLASSLLPGIHMPSHHLTLP